MKETKQVSEELKSEAVSLGLCQEWTKDWEDEDKSSLVEKYVAGIDFCIEHNYPSLAFMKENFDGVMQKYGVFAMEEFSVFNRTFIDINHGCIGSAKNNSHFDTDGYVRGNSVVDIVAMDNSSFHISVYDTSVLNVRCYDNSKVYILSKVKLKNQNNGMEIEYTIVAENEADIKLRKISVDSPLGKGLLGKAKGEIADITTPGGLLKFEIVDISR
jgi:transcription elongation factor GreA